MHVIVETNKAEAVYVISIHDDSVKYRSDWQARIVDCLGDRFSVRHHRRPGVGPDGNTCQKLEPCRLLRMEMSKPRHCVPYATPTITDVTGVPIFITMREHSFAINLRCFADTCRPRFGKLHEVSARKNRHS